MRFRLFLCPCTGKSRPGENRAGKDVYKRQHVEYVSITEGRYENNVWIPERQLNGDEFRIMFREKPSVLRCRFLRCR